ncbi:MAG: hypothetical protein AB7G93_22015 [Bdellovibrionales bacterium]
MKARVWITVLTSALAVNCAKKKSASEPAPPPPYVDVPASGPYVPPTTGPGYGPGDTFQYGGTTTFTFANKAVYNKYTGRYIQDLSQLTNVRINLNLDKYGSGFGGTVTIRYLLGNQIYEGYFTSGHDTESNKYNIWFTSGGKDVWHGFFEDFMGAIVVVIDNVEGLGDGSSTTTPTKVSGSVWFKNFELYPGYGPHPPTYCWFVSIGPYDCRAWPSGWGVNTTAAVEPDNGYTRLGTFKDLDLDKAFNDQVDL